MPCTVVIRKKTEDKFCHKQQLNRVSWKADQHVSLDTCV